MSDRSRLDEIEDANFAEKQILRKGKTKEEVKEMLLDRGASLIQIEQILNTIDSEFTGVLRIVSTKQKRFLNLLIDFSFLISIIILMSFILSEEAFLDYSMVIILLFPFFYYVVCEYRYGKTIGKSITGTFVVDKDGKSPNGFRILLRTVCRISPHHLISFFFHERTFHDRISGTYVVDCDKLQNMKENEMHKSLSIK